MAEQYYSSEELKKILTATPKELLLLDILPTFDELKRLFRIHHKLKSEDIVGVYKNYRLLLKLRIEEWVEQDVLRQIRIRQDGIPDLQQDGCRFLSYWGGKLSSGCKHCLNATNLSFRSSAKCDLNCKFCYYFGEVDGKFGNLPLYNRDCYQIGKTYFNLQSLKATLEKRKEGDHRTQAFGWVNFEPLNDEEKLYPAMQVLADKDYYQYLYTNGVRVTEDNLKKMADCGLNEIRFNLAATNCSTKIIKRISQATKWFPQVCIESPMYTEFFHSFMARKKAILDSGVTHIHFAELQLKPLMLKNKIWAEEGDIYRHHHGYISPIKSRQLVYDVFDTAVLEGWKGVTLHDCSNEVKLLRGFNPRESIDYRAYAMNYAPLPDDFYVRAAEKYHLSSIIKKLE